MMMSMRKRPRLSGWRGCRQRRGCLWLSRLCGCCCSGGLRRGCYGRDQMCRQVFGGVWMLRGSGCRWDSHLGCSCHGCSCLGCSRHHLDAIGEDLRAASLDLVLLRRLHQLHQLLLPLCDRVRPACFDGDEAVNGRGKILSQSRMGPCYERLKSVVRSHG